MPRHDLVADLIKASQPAPKRSSAAKAAAAKQADKAAFTDHLPQAKAAEQRRADNDSKVAAAKDNDATRKDTPPADAVAKDSSVQSKDGLAQDISQEKPKDLVQKSASEDGNASGTATSAAPLPVPPQAAVAAQLDLAAALLGDNAQGALENAAAAPAPDTAAGAIAAALTGTADSLAAAATPANAQAIAAVQAPVTPVAGDAPTETTPVQAQLLAVDGTAQQALPEVQQTLIKTDINDALKTNLAAAGFSADTATAASTVEEQPAQDMKAASPEALAKTPATDKDAVSNKQDIAAPKADIAASVSTKVDALPLNAGQNGNSPTAQVQQAPPQAPPAAANNISAQLRAPVALERVPFEIAAASHRGDKEFQIRLDPAELGGIDVTISVDKHGKVGAHLVVERPETLDQLRRDQQNLERALSNSGLKTDQGAMQFSLRDQNSNTPQQDDRGQNSRRGFIDVDLNELNGWASSPVVASLNNGRGSGIDKRV